MRLLLDTQAFIWFVENDNNLPNNVKTELEDTDNTLLVSIASLWEMTIKMSLGNLNLSSGIEVIMEKMYHNGFELLPIQPEHLIQLSTLKFYHKDPFDRIIIAQSLCENVKLVSSDEAFDSYDVKRLWA